MLTNAPSEELKSIEEEIRDLQKEMMELHTKRTSGRIIPDAYAKQGSKLADKIDALKIKRDELIKNKNDSEQLQVRLNEITKAIDSVNTDQEFDGMLFKKLIDEVTINDRNKLTFKFKVGITKTIVIDIK